VPEPTGSGDPSGRGTDVELMLQSWTPTPVAAARMSPLGLYAMLSGVPEETGSTVASGVSWALISFV
jgi:hypothetical protein